MYSCSLWCLRRSIKHLISTRTCVSNGVYCACSTDSIKAVRRTKTASYCIASCTTPLRNHYPVTYRYSTHCLSQGVPHLIGIQKFESHSLYQMAKHQEILSRSVVRSNLLRVDLTERLKEEDVVSYARQKRRASVLIPLIVTDEGDVLVLLTVRSQQLRNEAGTVAFPGGKQDEEDRDETDAALREAWEEIGLQREDVEVVSQLAPMVSAHGYFITPVTGFIPEDFQPKINPGEVDDVFRVPLMDFLTNDHHKGYQAKNVGRFARVHYFTHEIDGKKYVTWGLTAYLCILAACTVYQRPPDFDMEPGFDYTRSIQALLEYIERHTSNDMASSASKL